MLEPAQVKDSNPNHSPTLKGLLLTNSFRCKRSNEIEDPPNKKQKTKKKPEFVTIPMKEIVERRS